MDLDIWTVSLKSVLQSGANSSATEGLVSLETAVSEGEGVGLGLVMDARALPEGKLV